MCGFPVPKIKEPKAARQGFVQGTLKFPICDHRSTEVSRLRTHFPKCLAKHGNSTIDEGKHHLFLLQGSAVFTPTARERAEGRLLDDNAHHANFGLGYDNAEDLERKEVPPRPSYPYGATDPSCAGTWYLQPKDIVEVRHAGRSGDTWHTRCPLPRLIPRRPLPFQGPFPRSVSVRRKIQGVLIGRAMITPWCLQTPVHSVQSYMS